MGFFVLHTDCGQSLLNGPNFWNLKRSDSTFQQMKKGHGKLHWHLLCKGFNITYSAVSVSVLEPLARLQSWHQKHIMQFLYRGGWWTEIMLFFKTTACTDQTFHSAAFPYQGSVITNMEKLSRFSGKKHWGLKYIWSTKVYKTVKMCRVQIIQIIHCS